MKSAILYRENRKKVSLWSHLYLFSKWLSKWHCSLLSSGLNYALPATSEGSFPTAYPLGLILFVGAYLWQLKILNVLLLSNFQLFWDCCPLCHHALVWFGYFVWFSIWKVTAAGVILVGSCPSGTFIECYGLPFFQVWCCLGVSIETLSTLGTTHDSNPLVILGWSVRVLPVPLP